MLVFVMYYIYVTSGSSLLIESTDSMIILPLINSQCVCVRAFRTWFMHMQIIAVGVTNRHVQKNYSFRGPFWTALTHVCAFSSFHF